MKETKKAFAFDKLVHTFFANKNLFLALLIPLAASILPIVWQTKVKYLFFLFFSFNLFNYTQNKVNESMTLNINNSKQHVVLYSL